MSLQFVWLVCLLLVGGSFGLSLYAVRASRRRFMSNQITGRLRQMDVEIADLGDALESQGKLLKRLTNRQAVRDHRERKKAGAVATNESPEEFKRRMRLELAQGKLKP